MSLSAGASAQVGGFFEGGITPPFGISPFRPKLVVLIHGITPQIHEDRDAGISFSKHARYYWGFDFIKGVQGRTEEQTMRVITPRADGTMRFEQVNSSTWHPHNQPLDSYDRAPICVPIAGRKGPLPGQETDQNWIKSHITSLTSSANDAMVMINTRDGSKHLNVQLGEAIDELYSSYRTAFGHLKFDRQPQIYLVGHSFGGVIARALMANPAGPDLFGKSLTNLQRSRANYLRERVVLIHTLSTPHEGSFLPDMAGDVADYIDTVGYAVVSTVLETISWVPWKWKSEAAVKGDVKRTMEDLLAAVSGRRDSLKDIARMAEYNRGILNPSTLKRPNGEMVPIYTACGRNPGGMFYDASRSTFLFGGGEYNPVSNLDMIDGGRFAKEAMALSLIDVVMRTQGYGKEFGSPWGKATLADGDRTRGPYASLKPDPDEMPSPRTPATGLLLQNNGVRKALDAFLDGKPYIQNDDDGEWDNDGFVGFDSAHGLNIKASNWYPVYNRNLYGGMLPWDIDNHGSMMFNAGNGLWIHNELLREAGPQVFTPGLRRSQWSNLDFPETPSSNIRIDFAELGDVDKNIDYFFGSEMSMKVRIGDQEWVFNGPEDTYTVTQIPSYTVRNYPGTVIPIRIMVWERDQPYDPDDLCMATPYDNFRSSIYLYYDVRTGRITGDVKGAAGQLLESRAWGPFSNRARVKFKIQTIQ